MRLEGPTDRVGYRIVLRADAIPSLAKSDDEDDEDAGNERRAYLSEGIANALAEWAVATAAVPALDDADVQRLAYGLLLPLAALRSYVDEGLMHDQIAHIHNCRREVVHQRLHILRDPARSLARCGQPKPVAPLESTVLRLVKAKSAAN